MKTNNINQRREVPQDSYCYEYEDKHLVFHYMASTDTTVLIIDSVNWDEPIIRYIPGELSRREARAVYESWTILFDHTRTAQKKSVGYYFSSGNPVCF